MTCVSHPPGNSYFRRAGSGLACGKFSWGRDGRYMPNLASNSMTRSFSSVSTLFSYGVLSYHIRSPPSLSLLRASEPVSAVRGLLASPKYGSRRFQLGSLDNSKNHSQDI